MAAMEMSACCAQEAHQDLHSKDMTRMLLESLQQCTAAFFCQLCGSLNAPDPKVVQQQRSPLKRSACCVQEVQPGGEARVHDEDVVREPAAVHSCLLLPDL